MRDYSKPIGKDRVKIKWAVFDANRQHKQTTKCTNTSKSISHKLCDPEDSE